MNPGNFCSQERIFSLHDQFFRFKMTQIIAYTDDLLTVPNLTEGEAKAASGENKQKQAKDFPPAESKNLDGHSIQGAPLPVGRRCASKKFAAVRTAPGDWR